MAIFHMLGDVLSTCGATGYLVVLSSALSLLAALASFVLSGFRASAVRKFATVARLLAWGCLTAIPPFGGLALWLTHAKCAAALAEMEAGSPLDVAAFSAAFIGHAYVAGIGLFLPLLTAMVALGCVLGSALQESAVWRCLAVGFSAIVAAVLGSLPLLITGSIAMSTLLNALSAPATERVDAFRAALAIARASAAEPWSGRLSGAVVFSCIGAALVVFAGRRAWVVGRTGLIFAALWLGIGVASFILPRWV